MEAGHLGTHVGNKYRWLCLYARTPSNRKAAFERGHPRWMPLGWVQCLKPLISPVLKFGRDDQCAQELEADRSTPGELLALGPRGRLIHSALLGVCTVMQDDKLNAATPQLGGLLSLAFPTPLAEVFSSSMDQV